MQWLWLRNNLEQMFQASMSTLWEKKNIIIIIIFYRKNIIINWPQISQAWKATIGLPSLTTWECNQQH